MMSVEARPVTLISTVLVDSTLAVKCRERNDGLYRVITYLVSKMLEELMLAFLASLVFSCIVFYGVKLQGAWVLFWLVYLVTLSCGIGGSTLS